MSAALRKKSPTSAALEAPSASRVRSRPVKVAAPKVPPLPTERPLRIGVSARLLYQVPSELGFRNKNLQYIEQSLAHWIMEHGAIAFMVPAVAHDSKHAARHLKVEHVVQELDALVLQGGADVAPQTYGQAPIDPRNYGAKNFPALFEATGLFEIVKGTDNQAFVADKRNTDRTAKPSD